jgi:hypothetical protein
MNEKDKTAKPRRNAGLLDFDYALRNSKPETLIAQHSVIPP